ncbi:hypothetical protein SAMN05428969_0272 [Devosia sp. YR412]|uniref:DUF6538 domain-containing protein n=1 Tax=Devosia sp. YR412 TaxID=1881030 RepID=UPI0008BB1FB4|nr:DUF6538 domain-containing protein [Devosia sp. YR412]SEP64197.1 hypothetical protein SAMN05428969_0272 [Devosia sp. YR412]
MPESLHALVGKREVKISLGTKDPIEAKKMLSIVSAEADAEWARLIETPGRPHDVLTREQIVALSGELYHDLLKEHGSDPGEPWQWAAKLSDIQRALPERMRTGRLPTTFFQGWFFEIGTQSQYFVGEQIDRLLDRKGLNVDWETRIKLCMAGATAVAQAYRELEKRANDDFRPYPDAQRFPDWKNVERTEPLLWREAYALYEAENEPAPASVKRQKGSLASFFEFQGHDDMMRVTHDDVQRWVAHRLNKVAGRTVRYADVAHPRTLFIYAKGKRLIDHVPFEGVKVRYKEKPKLREREFTLAEAERILTASLVEPPRRMSIEGAAARRWVPWLCAYSGARVNEITQARALDVTEVKSQNGQLVWCINITPEAGRVKTNKARSVPLHPHLIEQGFLDYVESRKGKHLFYDPKRRRGGSDANPQYKKVGERLAAWVRSAAISVTDVGVDPNHGWRHLFRSATLERAWRKSMAMPGPRSGSPPFPRCRPIDLEVWHEREHGRYPGVGAATLEGDTYLHQFYTRSDPDVSGRTTVPVLWD